MTKSASIEQGTMANPSRERARLVIEQVEQLKRFFRSTTSLAKAVGVTRDTVHAWARGDASRIRQANEARVARLLRVCLAAEEHLPGDELVGRWMNAPQTFLYGGTPIEFLASDGEPDFLIESMESPAPVVTEKALRALADADRELAQLVSAARRRPDVADAERQTSLPLSRRPLSSLN